MQGALSTDNPFRWQIPGRFNIGVDVCDKWRQEPHRLALIHKSAHGPVVEYTFDDISRLSNQTANLLLSGGLRRQERIAVLLPQMPETAIAHVAIYKMGAIAVPLFTLFGTEALEYRLADSGARAVITDLGGAAKLAQIRQRLPQLKLIYTIDGVSDGSLDFHRGLSKQSDAFDPVATFAEDPALIIYTSGTTGSPKGALHAHRVLLGHLPGVEMSHDYAPQPGDRFWTPADWAWIGGLYDVLMPAWHHGLPVVSHRFVKFDPEAAFQLIADLGIRNAFLPPTALKMMRSVANPNKRWQLQMRSIASGGESLGRELLSWGRETFGLTINEFYGQTECNVVVSSCASAGVAKPGHIGKAVPGHRLAIVDQAGQVVAAGVAGNIAVQRPDPVMFLRYWNNDAATAAKFVGDWLLTGDIGESDAEGYVRFVGRDDDVITSGGYRIGPGEVEDCLLGHPAVRLAAVIGVPDALRTELVKAFVVLNDGVVESAELIVELQHHVRTRLSAHEYPRQIEFIDSLPMTATGKIIRRLLRGAPGLISRT
ncbi:MAG: acyl-CoA synthetase [Gammaproteobacteria bacterium]